MRAGIAAFAAALVFSASPAFAARGTGILAVGDFGVGGDVQRSLGATMKRFEGRHPAKLLVTLGDNDYTASPSSFLTNWRESFGWLPRAGVRVAGTLGNHDVRVDSGRYQFAALGMPHSYYSRCVANVELFLLDSNSVSATQTGWLRRRLARSKARWKIVAFHHPAYTCGGYRSDPAVVEHWVPLFERYRVQLVLSGHDHNYQRFAPRRRVTYVVHGGGGAGLYGLETCPPGYPRRVFGRAGHGFLYLVAARDRLQGFALSASGGRVDRFTVRRRSETAKA